MAGRFSGIKQEFQKIYWTDRKQTAKQTVAVIVVSAIMGVLIVFFDMIIQYGLDFIFKL